MRSRRERPACIRLQSHVDRSRAVKALATNSFAHQKQDPILACRGRWAVALGRGCRCVIYRAQTCRGSKAILDGRSLAQGCSRACTLQTFKRFRLGHHAPTAMSCTKCCPCYSCDGRSRCIIWLSRRRLCSANPKPSTRAALQEKELQLHVCHTHYCRWLNAA